MNGLQRSQPKAALYLAYCFALLITPQGVLAAEARTVELDNGDTYTGELVDGVRTGSGVYQWADGNRYEGNFLDNYLHGSGGGDVQRSSVFAFSVSALS